MFDEGGCQVCPERGHGESTLLTVTDGREAQLPLGYHLFRRLRQVSIVSDGPGAVHWATLLWTPKEKLLKSFFP